MDAMNVLDSELTPIVQRALVEDVGAGDVTSRWILPRELRARGEFVAKADGVVAGLAVAREVFRQVDAGIAFEALSADGNPVAEGEVLATVEGPAVSILTAERTALNFLQRMSGIATLTRQYVLAVVGTEAVILDTRKTAPGLRPLDKWAVRLGGGQNHRMGLYDMVLIKDNHIAAAGSITAAVQQVWLRNAQTRLPIEVEVKNFTELDEVLALDPPVDRIMLDNMSVDRMARAVRIAGGRVPLEASGNVTLDTVRDVALTGVDFISIGALTHSVRALDISLELTAGS